MERISDPEICSKSIMPECHKMIRKRMSSKCILYFWSIKPRSTILTILTPLVVNKIFADLSGSYLHVLKSKNILEFG
jgi:hypothetical protein